MAGGGDRVTAPPVTSSGQLPARIGALDGLRSLVLLVLFFHFSLEAVKGMQGPLAVPVMVAGLLGVVALDVFFVLSGFLITGILLDTKGAPDFFRNFYLRRAARILPVYYGFLILYVLVLPRLVPWDPVAVRLTFAQQLPYWFHFVNIPFGLDGHLAAFTGHYWSLSIEEQFYLVWPLVVFVSSRARLRQVAIGCLVVAPVVRMICSYGVPDHILFAYTFTPGRLDGLALGALLAIAWREPGTLLLLVRTLQRSALAGVIVAAALIASIVAQLGQGGFVPDWRLPLFLTASAWCAAALVGTILTGGGGVLRRLAESAPARRVGLYSYAIYIIHDPLAYVLDQFSLIHRPGPGSATLHVLGYVALMMAICIAIAAASWHAFEKPLLRWRPRQTRPAVTLSEEPSR